MRTRPTKNTLGQAKMLAKDRGLIVTLGPPLSSGLATYEIWDPMVREFPRGWKANITGTKEGIKMLCWAIQSIPAIGRRTPARLRTAKETNP